MMGSFTSYRAPEWVLVGLLTAWFLPFFGAPLGLGFFLVVSALIALLGVVVKRLTLPVLAVILFFTPQNIVNGTGTYTFTIVLLEATVLALVVYLRSAWVTRKFLPSRRQLVVGGIVLCYLAGSLVIGTLSDVPIAQQVVIIRVVILALLCAYLLITARQLPPDALSHTIFFLGIAGVLLSLLVALQVIIGFAPFLDTYAQNINYTSAAFGGRAGGNMGHPIIAGTVLVLTALLVVAARTRGWWLIAPVCLAASLTTGSRSAWLAAAAGLLVLGARLLRERVTPRTFWLMLGGAGIVAAAALALLTTETMKQFLSGKGLLSRLNVFADASAGYRGTRTERAWSLITDSPFAFIFGHGPGYGANYLANVGIGDGQPDTFDQSYLAIWVDFGLVAVMALFLPMLWIVLRRMGRAESMLAIVFLVIAAFVMILNWAALLGAAILATTFARHTTEPGVTKMGTTRTLTARVSSRRSTAD